MTKQRITKLKSLFKILSLLLFGILCIFILLASIGTVAQATGLVDNTVDNANEYSRYPLEHYTLDFYVDNSWNWLPWNWTDGIGQQVMYALYALASFVWTINLYLSYATGYLIQEAYSLDFISDTADAIGENMQTLAGITRSGISSEGFYIGFLLLLILIIGIYVTYTGLLKRETTKAVQGVMSFLVTFLLSSAFIAYAPDTIHRINEFSSDISQASLSLGTRITLPNSESEGSDSVDLIRDSLFSIQVRQPWLLLQYGTNDEEELGAERIEALLSTSPTENNGESRETIVIEEIEERDNPHMTITQTTSRLGVVFFISIFNVGISIFVFLLTGIMIFSQVLFIIYAMFLPISFLLSMIPSFGHMSKRALTKLFNTILARAGITLILTIAFSLSSMLYSLSSGYPFFLIAFLQIVTFAGIYFKLSDLMGMFALQSNESQSVSRRVMRKPRLLMHANMHRLQRKLGQSLTLLGAGTAASKTAKKPTNDQEETSSDSKVFRSTPKKHQRDQEKRPSSKLEKGSSNQLQKRSFGKIRKPVPTMNKRNERPIKKQEEDSKPSVKTISKKSSTPIQQNRRNLSAVQSGKKDQQKNQATGRTTVTEKRLEADRKGQINRKYPPSYPTPKNRKNTRYKHSSLTPKNASTSMNHSIVPRLREQKGQKNSQIKRQLSSKNKAHYRKTPTSIKQRPLASRKKFVPSNRIQQRKGRKR